MLENRFKLGVMVLTAIGVLAMFTGCSSTRDRPYTLEELQMIERVNNIRIQSNLIEQQHLNQASGQFRRAGQFFNGMAEQEQNTASFTNCRQIGFNTVCTTQ